MDALLVVDVQNDFFPGGSLPVADGHMVISPLNRMIRFASEYKMPVIASLDWHPLVTSHFKQYGGKWPPHCVMWTRGASFHPDLHVAGIDTFVFKGMNLEEDAYSAFQARTKSGENLEKYLHRRKINKLYIGGLATDHCVKASVCDALRRDFETVVLEDAIRGVELKKGDTAQALNEMRADGANFTTTEFILNLTT